MELSRILEAMPIPLALSDDRNNIVYLNKAFLQTIGYTTEEIPDLEHWRRLAYPDPQYRKEVIDAWQNNLEVAKSTGAPYMPIEARITCRDGNIRTFLISPEVIGVDLSATRLIVFYDITERRAAEGKVQRITKLYKALSQVNQAIIHMETEETLFPLVCRMAVDLGGMVLATIRQLNPEANLLESVESYGNGADYLKNITISASDAVPEGRGPAGTSFRESRVVIIPHYQTNEMTKPWHDQAKRFGWGSSGTFPILRGGKPYASLGVYHGDENAFDSDAIDLLDEMARDISFALDSFDREKERQKARSDLVASERHFRAYFDYAMVGMAAASITTGKLLEVNEALCKMLDYSAAELMQMTWAEITHPEDIEKSAEAVERILLGKATDFEIHKRYVRKDGNIVHAHIASRAVYDETEKLGYLVSIIDDITEIKNHESQLEHLIHHDPLTGLPNRVLLNDRLDMAVSRANRSGQNIAVCFMDLDGFKLINDKYGHAAGDALLVEIARRLSASSRSIDTVARLGGDEFILILNGISGEEECRHMLERVMEIIRNPFEINGSEVQISSSIGVAIYPDHVTDGAALLRHADQAMYIAKQKGRSRIHFFDAVNDHLAQVRSEGLSRIEQGLQNNELVLFYQPIINMRSGNVVGMEALIRWQHPERGLLTPGEFMPLVENSEFEMRLAEWVIAQGMAQMEAWHRQGLKVTVSVNLPARYLQSHGFVDFIVPLICPHTEMASNAIRLEILETAALGDLGSAIKKMDECINHGIQFSIDDFGTGYASLSYLRRLPADTIKIDQSFVLGMLEDLNDLSIVQGVMGLADAFQKRVVAEGVETIEHGAKLLAMGCEYGQGYGIARPMGAERVLSWVREFRLPSEWNELSVNQRAKLTRKQGESASKFDHPWHVQSSGLFVWSNLECYAWKPSARSGAASWLKTRTSVRLRAG